MRAKGDDDGLPPVLSLASGFTVKVGTPSYRIMTGNPPPYDMAPSIPEELQPLLGVELTSECVAVRGTDFAVAWHLLPPTHLLPQDELYAGLECVAGPPRSNPEAGLYQPVVRGHLRSRNDMAGTKLVVATVCYKRARGKLRHLA